MRLFPLPMILLATLIAATQLTAQAASWNPSRINKAIELLDSGQPIYYVGCGECDYDAGVALAQTGADYIDYGMEHTFLDIPRLRRFMEGLVAGGPTRSGHRTPTVIVSTPAIGWTETSMRANTWMVQHILAAGAHGLLLTHAVDPAAVRIMIEAIRYPFATVAPGLAQGMRGAGSSGFAAGIWGISSEEYLQRADPWPLNPDGELLIGLKIENIHAVENAETLANIPGVGFAEAGLGDQAYWLGHIQGLGRPAERWGPENVALGNRVSAAIRGAGGFFLIGCTPENIVERIAEGAMVCAGGVASAEIGRRHTNRQMPW